MDFNLQRYACASELGVTCLIFRSSALSAESEIISYRDFWDIPRIFIVRHHGRQYLFDCRFNETAEDFDEVYRVYVLPELLERELRGSWTDLAERAESYLGEIATSEVKFDASRRRSIDPGIIDELLNNIGGGRS
jgi:hypothetical protein